MTRIILDIHVLQTVPPSNLNRDDTGSPKTALYGGVRRARVSSQAWKRATRTTFADLLDPAELGVRTKRVADLLAERITAIEPTLKDAGVLPLAAVTLEAATGAKIEPPKRRAEAAKKAGEPEPSPEASYLMFLSARQLQGLAELAVEGAADIKAFFTDKENKHRARQIVNTSHSVDIALFGRMVANATDLNVDAAAQVAHAISVHAVENESDYFTAVDDRNTDAEPGAGMIGTVEFNSATLYRYAALDVNLLGRNLGEGLREDEPATEPVRRAVQAFIHGFVTSLPTGKMNTFGNHTLPDAVVVKLRTDRPVNFVGAFESPVPSSFTAGHLEGAAQALATYIPECEAVFGAITEGTWVLRVGNVTEPLAALGTSVTLRELVTTVGAAIADRLNSGA